jgi:hypothetical protein
MASYPTAVKSFTTKTAAQTIASAHMNDVQDEINAIEDGLLNATAPLNSSNSTVANLSVTGGSTFAGNVTISGELGVVKSPPYALCRQSTVVAVAHNTFVQVSLDADVFLSTATMHSTSSNPTRVVPPSSGVYLLQGAVDWADFSTAGHRVTDLKLNSTTVIYRLTQTAPATAIGGTFSQLVAMTYKLQTTDYVELQVYQDSGSTGSLSNGFQTPWLSVTKVR